MYLKRIKTNYGQSLEVSDGTPFPPFKTETMDELKGSFTIHHVDENHLGGFHNVPHRPKNIGWIIVVDSEQDPFSESITRDQLHLISKDEEAYIIGPTGNTVTVLSKGPKTNWWYNDGKSWFKTSRADAVEQQSLGKRIVELPEGERPTSPWLIAEQVDILTTSERMALWFRMPGSNHWSSTSEEHISELIAKGCEIRSAPRGQYPGTIQGSALRDPIREGWVNR